jgi:Fe-S-cluster-containing dehydrogenase component
MARYGMAIDTTKCVGCMDCVVACKTENGVPEGLNRDWIAYDTTGAFPDLHMEIRSKACIAACPYDARFIHPDGYADKCTFCIHRVEEGLAPACVAVCPTRCMHFGDLDDPNSEVSRLLRSRKNHPLVPEAGTRPQIFYLT